VSTGCCWKESIFSCLESIKRAGFHQIEVCSHPGHLDYHDVGLVQCAARLIRSLELEAYSFHAPFREEIDITSLDDGARTRAKTELLRAADAAAMLGAKYFVLHPGPERTELPDTERLARLANAARVLEDAYCHCHSIGIKLVLENMLPHLFAGRTDNLLWLLETLHKSDFGICLDTGHAFLGRDLTDTARRFSTRLTMIHASDNHGDWDEHLPPGDGDILWPALLRQLRHLGFHGALILEVAGLDDQSIAVDRARRGKDYLERLTKSLDHTFLLPH
jgi:sugar phosphate isomerase/epimerase